MPLSSRSQIDALEPRRLLSSQSPIAINFTDEALWDQNFDTAVAQAKALGVTAVRIWFGFDDYNARPNAWDPVAPFGAVTAGTVAPDDPSLNYDPTVMKRAFQLHDDGFSVTMVLEPNAGLPPTSTNQVTNLVDYLMTAPDAPGSTRTLSNVIDYWEIGNEPDQSAYWQPSATNVTTGLQSYVDNFLIPAATELHNFLPTPDKVISGGVAGNPAYLKTILTELNAQNATSLIDYVGFHPYGTYDPTNPSVPNTILTNTQLALQYAGSYGKQLIATEWNVRGFSNTGSQNAVWAQAIDYEYKNVIQPNYAMAFYFTLINNWSARGGTTSARPAGLLVHDSPITVTPASAVPDLATYYESPLVPAQPFYNMFMAWQYGTVSGAVPTTTGGGTSTPVSVYVDLNNNGTLDAGEPFATTDANGNYTLQYSVGTVTAGTYNLRIATPNSLTPVVGTQSIALTNLVNLTNIDFAVTPATNDPTTLATVVGALWNDADGNGAINGTETGLGGWSVYLDLNGNGQLDSNEPSTTTAGDGSYVLSFDPTQTTASTAVLSVIAPTGWLTTLTPTVSFSVGSLQTGVMVGAHFVPTTGTISGYLWNDGNGDGLFDGADTYTGSRVVFVDANGNGILDAGELQTTSDTNGNFSFASLAPGTYEVTRVFPTGYHISNSNQPYVAVTVVAGQTSIANIGTTNVATPTPTPPVTPTPPPTTPTPPPTTTPIPTTGTISGYLFSDANGDGIKDGTDAFGPDRVVFLDTNGNGKLDAGEKQTTSDANGNYSFAGLTPGTYNVTRVFPTGYHISNSTAADITVTVIAGQTTTANIGSISNTATPTPTPPVTPTPTPPSTPTPPPTTPTPPPTTPIPTTGTISGYLFSDANGDGIKDGTDAFGPDRVVFLDTNGNGKLDAGEKQTTSDANGNYSFTGLLPGTYNVTRVFPTGYHISNSTTADITVAVVAGQTTTANIGSISNTATPTPTPTPPVTPTPTPPSTPTPPPTTPTPPPTTTGTGSISGTIYIDANKNYKRDTGEVGVAGVTVYVDANNNGQLDSGEISTLSTATGAYTLSSLSASASNEAVRILLPSGYTLKGPNVASNSSYTVKVTATTKLSGEDFGLVGSGAVTPPPTTPTTTGNIPASVMTISGYLWNDGNGDGLFDGADTYTASRTVFIDPNGNGQLDAGELSTTSDANGLYQFAGLTAGTYKITRVFPSGYHISNSSSPDITLTLAAGQSATGSDIGSTNVTTKPIDTRASMIVIFG